MFRRRGGTRRRKGPRGQRKEQGDTQNKNQAGRRDVDIESLFCNSRETTAAPSLQKSAEPPFGPPDSSSLPVALSSTAGAGANRLKASTCSATSFRLAERGHNN